MQQDILIIGVLFPAIPLMMINFGNRYSVLATLIRNLHDNVIRDNTTPDDASRFLRQITSLRKRLQLIGIVQTCAATAFVAALSAMIAMYLDQVSFGSWLFFTSIVLLMVAMSLFMLEIQIANRALDVHLSDLEDRQEWEAYLHPPRKSRRGKTAAKKAKQVKQTKHSGTAKSDDDSSIL